MTTEQLTYSINEKGARVVERNIDDIGSTAEKSGKRVGLLISALGAIATSSILKSMFGVIAANQQLEASLKTVTGGAAEAENAMNLIRDTASQLPSSIEDITGSFIKLTALGLTPSQEALISYSNTASAMGKSLNQFVEAVADATTGEFERLKEFGIKSKSQGDQITFTFQGVATTIQKNASDIEGYLRGIGDVQFAGAAAEQMNTLNGRLSLLRDEVRLLIVDIGEGGLSSAFDFVLGGATALVKGLKQLPNVFTALFAAVDKGILIIKFRFEVLTTSIQFLWAKAINGSKAIFGSFLEFVAKGLDLIGADDTARGLTNYADSLKSASRGVAPLSDEINRLNSELQKQKQIIDDTAVAIISENLARQKAAFTNPVAKPSAVSSTSSNKGTKGKDDVADEVINNVSYLQQLRTDLFNQIRQPVVQLSEVSKILNEFKEAKVVSGDEATLFLTDNGLIEKQTLGLQAYIAEYNRATSEIDILRQNDLLNEQQATQAKAKLYADLNQQRLSNTQAALGNLATLANSENKKAARVGKAAAISQATIDGFLAVQRALASAAPPYNYILAATVTAATAANIANIRSQPTGFMTGGSFTVGGQGGADSQLVPILASPGEKVTVSKPEQVRRGNPNGDSSGGGSVVVMVANFSDMKAAEEWLDSGAADKKLLNRLDANGSQVKQIVSNA